MYCTTCGAPNPSYANYCYKDGTALHKEKVLFAYMKEPKAFCPHCGHSLLEDYLYCPLCGTSLFHVYVDKNGKMDTPTEEMVTLAKTEWKPFSIFSFLSLFSHLHWRRIFLAVATSFLLLFLLSAIIAKVMMSAEEHSLLHEMNKEINGMLGYLEDLHNVTIEKPDKLVTLNDVVLWTHIVKSTLELEVTYSSFDENDVMQFHSLFNNGVVFWLLVPFFALLIGGVLIGKISRENVGGIVRHLLAFSFLYSITLAVLSIFAGFSYHVDINHSEFSASIDSDVTYSFLSVLLKGFVFAFLFAGIGILVSRGYKRSIYDLKTRMQYGDLIYNGWAWTLRGIMLLFVLCLPFIFKWWSQLMNSIEVSVPENALPSKWFIIACVALQMAAWIWVILHFGVLHLEYSNLESGHQLITYGLFSNFKMESGDTDLYNNVYEIFHRVGFFEKDIYLQVLILLPIIIFLYVGYNIRRKYTVTWKPILVFSLLYSIGLIFVSFLSRFGLSYFISFNGEEEMEFSLFIFLDSFSLLVKCFIFAFLFTYMGAWIQQFSWKHYREGK